jgi:peptide deformylase
MSIRESIQIGHPALKSANALISDFSSKELSDLIQDLTDTMEAAGLIGMAAPQIAENFQVFVTHPRETPTRPKDQADDLRVFINPKLVFESKEQVLIYEGCGSVLHATLFGPVIRPQVVTIEAFDQQGKKFRFTADGILGRVIQHEYDHMRGIEFLEKISDYKKMMSVEFFIEKIKTSPDQMKASIITRKEFEDLS